MNGIGRILNLLRKETPSPGTDYTGTVTKVEGGVAYVQLAGSDIDDTPVRMSVAAKKGDTVRVRVNKGRAWITGNDTAPPTDDAYAKESEIVLSNEIEKTNITLKRVDGVATKAHKIAGNTDQYFWHVTSGEDTGAHLTDGIISRIFWKQSFCCLFRHRQLCLPGKRRGLWLLPKGLFSFPELPKVRGSRVLP